MSFEHQSQLETRTRGIALLETDDTAQVGMGGNTCAVETGSGMIGADFDVAQGEEDNVQDAVGDSTIVVGAAGVYVLDDGFFGVGSPVVSTTGVREGRFTDAGVTVLRATGDGCAVEWFNGGDQVGSVNVGDSCDSAGFTVDRETGRTFVAMGDRVAFADASGATSVPAAADLVAWDAVAQVLYTAEIGGSTVTAFEADGAQRWVSDVPGTITSLDDMGPLGSVAVMVQMSDRGELVVLDGLTGEATSNLPTPSAASKVVVGNNGTTMAMILENEVHFFGVDLTLE